MTGFKGLLASEEETQLVQFCGELGGNIVDWEDT